MWTCPHCGAEFVQENLSHSCGHFTVDAFLRGKSQRAIELFWFFIHSWNKVGAVKVHPVKTSVSLLVEVRFCRINRVTTAGILGHLWLKERIISRKFFKVEKFRRNDYVHHFELKDESFIDDEFLKYMKMSYEIGRRKHLELAKDEPVDLRTTNRNEHVKWGSRKKQ
ncbi:MAG: DUF5655 domain-containing protein [Pyrinomonadaceae bacterium]